MTNEDIEKLRHDTPTKKWTFESAANGFKDWKETANLIEKYQDYLSENTPKSEFQTLKEHLQSRPGFFITPPIETVPADLNLQKQIQNYYRHN